MEHSGAPAQGDAPADPWLPGRRAELAALAERVRAVGPGGSALIVRGAAGSGKSALLRAVRGFATEAGFLVLATSGVPTEVVVPYAGLHELLRPLLDAVRTLPAAQGAALHAAFGFASDADSGPAANSGTGVCSTHAAESSLSCDAAGCCLPRDPAGPPPEPALVALATLRLLADAAAVRPVLAVVDDVAWLDEPSSAVVAFLARRIGDDPVLLCAAARTVPGRQPFAADLDGLELTGLDATAAAEVLAVTGHQLTPAAREEIRASAQGSPLALTELPRTGQGPAATGDEPLGTGPTWPRRLEHAFAALFDALPRPARDAVLVAAVDPACEVAVILAAAGRLGGATVTLRDLKRAEAAGLLRIQADRVRFRHHLVRSSVLHAQPRTRHRAAHTALGAVLRADPHRSPADPYRASANSYRAAWHRALGLDRPDDAVADELAAAHRIALARGSAALAIRALERAAHLTREPDRRRRRLLLAAEHGVRLGRADLVRPLLDAAARTGPGERDRNRDRGQDRDRDRGQDRDRDRGRALIAWLSERCDEAGAPGGAGALELCARAEDAARAGDRALALDLLLAAARSCRWAATRTPARQRVLATVTRLKDPAWDPRLTTAQALADPVRQCADVTEQLTRAATVGGVDADGLRLLGVAAQAVGDPVLATRFLDRAESRSRARGDLTALSRVLAVQTRARLDLGDCRRAAEAAAELHRLAPELRNPSGAAGTLVAEARVAALSGDIETAQRLADRAEKAGRGEDTGLSAEVALVRGIAACAAGHHDEAYDALRTLFPDEEPLAPGASPTPGSTPSSPAQSRAHTYSSPAPDAAHEAGPDPAPDIDLNADPAPAPDPDGPLCRPGFGAVGLLAEAAVHSGRRAEAMRVVAAFARRTAGSPAPLLRVHLRYAVAVLADDIDAETLFRRALADNLARWPWPRARAELAYGSWLRRQRRTAESRPLLRSARLTFERIGAGPWAARADDELRAAGERATPPGETSPLRERTLAARALTPLEAQIARIAGLGLSDHEVGEQLFLSPRAVGAHLSRILSRLDIASRDRLGTVLDAAIG